MNSNYHYYLPKVSIRATFLAMAFVLAAMLFFAVDSRAAPAPVDTTTNGLPTPPDYLAQQYLQQMPRHGPSEADVTKDAVAQVQNAVAFYRSLQTDKQTAVPARVVTSAKGLLIIDEWAGIAGVGFTGGDALGFVKQTDGAFSKPVFYSIAGGSLGLRLGVSRTHAVVFLMSEKAMQGFANGQFIGNNVAWAVLGQKSTFTEDALQKADVIVYQTANGLDIGASFGGLKLAVNTPRNEYYYRYFGVQPKDIFAGEGQTPEGVKTLLAAINPPPSPGMLASNAP